jgi:hypothetical protein
MYLDKRGLSIKPRTKNSNVKKNVSINKYTIFCLRHQIFICSFFSRVKHEAWLHAFTRPVFTGVAEVLQEKILYHGLALQIFSGGKKRFF